MRTKRMWVSLLCVLLAAAMALPVVGCAKKDKDKEPTVTAPVITGVTNNGTYYLGKDTIAPAYDKGSGMMTKDGGTAYAFASGTAVTALGDYVLTVTLANGDDPKVTTASFSVKEFFTEYAGQITDMFDNTRLNDAYILDSNTSATVKDGVATIANKAEGDPWSIVKRKFAKVDATANPYLEVKVDRISNGRGSRLEVWLSNTEYDTDEGSKSSSIGEIAYGGTYRFSVLDWVNGKQLNASEQDIYLIFKVVGKTAGYAAADIDYVKSIVSVPAAVPAGAYVDQTEETLGKWREDTVKYELSEGVMFAFVDPGHDEGYGKMIKRVALNTKEYPFLVVDVDSVAAGTSWNLKYSAAGVDGEPSFMSDSSAVGRYEIDLSKIAALTDKEYIEVTLALYIIGKGDENVVGINGFETVAESERAPALNENFANTAAWSNGGSEQTLTLSVADNKGTFTLGQSGYACMNFAATLNSIAHRYLVFDVESAASNHIAKYNGKGLYAEAKTTGKIYVDLQNEAFGFASGYNVAVSIEFYLIGDPAQPVVLNSITTTNEAPDKSLIEDFSKDDWSHEAGLGTVTIADNTLKLEKPAGNGQMGKTQKTNFAMDTSADHVLKFGVKEASFTFDEGFKIKISNRTLPGWPTITVQGDTMTKIAREGGGWDVYADLEALATAAALDTASFVGNVSLSFEIVIEFGDAAKSVTFDFIRLVNAVPSVS